MTRESPFEVPKSPHYFVYHHKKGTAGRWKNVTSISEEVANVVGHDFARESAQRMIDFGYQMDKRVIFNGKELFR